MEFTFDKQILDQRCPSCEMNFTVVRGSIYADGSEFGLYLIALHGHAPDGQLGHVAISLLDNADVNVLPQSAAINVISTSEKFGFKLIDWDASPWLSESYLGQMLTPDQVRGSSLRSAFFEVAERVVGDLPEVQTYFK